MVRVLWCRVQTAIVESATTWDCPGWRPGPRGAPCGCSPSRAVPVTCWVLGDESLPCCPRPGPPCRPEALFLGRDSRLRVGKGRRQPDGARVGWTRVLGKESTASGLAVGWARGLRGPHGGARTSPDPRVCSSTCVHTHCKSMYMPRKEASPDTDSQSRQD